MYVLLYHDCLLRLILLACLCDTTKKKFVAVHITHVIIVLQVLVSSSLRRLEVKWWSVDASSSCLN